MINNRQSGFTLTELMFAMMFVTFLLVFGVTVIVQSMQIYNKGLAIRNMTQSGRQITEDISRSLRYAGNVQVTQPSTPNQIAQRVCTGQLTYVWNIGEADTTNKYSDISTPIRLAQVSDPGGTLCKSTADIDSAKAKEIVSTSLAVQCFTPQLRESGSILDINFVISTAGSNPPQDVNANGNNIDCDRDPNPLVTTMIGIECPAGSEGAFCAVGEFDTSVYVRSK